MLKDALNAGYGTMPADGPVDRIVSSQRRKLFDAFIDFRRGDAADTVLNVYMKSVPPFDNMNYLAAWSSMCDSGRITSCEIEPLPMTGRGATPLRLPYADRAFDWIFCNEVIEHAGDTYRQSALVQELYRVARKGVFATASNRRHPIEFKTGLPFIHWLPDGWWRRLLRLLGKREWASVAILNPVDAQALYRFASQLPSQPEHDVGHKRVFGIKAHLFLMIRKRPS